MFCFLPITSLTFATLPPSEVQTASGLYNLMRNLGGAIGLAVCNTWLQNWTKRSYLVLRENVTEANQISSDAISLYQQNFESFNLIDGSAAAIQSLYLIAQRESYIITFNNVCIATSILFFISVFLMPLVNKVDPNASPSSESH